MREKSGGGLNCHVNFLTLLFDFCDASIFVICHLHCMPLSCSLHDCKIMVLGYPQSHMHMQSRSYIKYMTLICTSHSPANLTDLVSLSGINSFDPDQFRHIIGPVAIPNCLQRSSADDIWPKINLVKTLRSLKINDAHVQIKNVNIFSSMFYLLVGHCHLL